jgi:DNA repair protein RadD
VNLRPYQRESVDALWRYFERDTGNPLVVAPTGSGKSVLIATFVREVLATYPDTRVLVMTHVKELVEQDAAKLEALLPFGMVGVYSAGLRRREVGRAVTVASVQSIAANMKHLPSVDLVIIDEAHLVPPDGEGRYRTVLDSLRALVPHVKVIGFSATPYRLKSGWLHTDGGIFTDIAHEVEIPPLVEAGYLCRMRSKAGRAEADLSGVHVRGGEYIAAEVEAAMDTEALVHRACDEIDLYCWDRRKWLIFCAGLGHVEHVAEELRRRGHAIATVSGETPREERDNVVAGLRSGVFRGVVNCNVLTTGFDAPDIDAVVLLRATKSPGLYMQMVGRGMRPHPAKTDCMVLDFGGNIRRHGPIDAVTPQASSGGGTAPIKTCPECREVIVAAALTCPACGHVFEVVKKAPHKTVAEALPVLSEDVEVVVSSVGYHLHAKPGKPPSMRVDYRCGLATYSEWVCFDHGEFPARKARGWWRHRDGAQPPPQSTAEALERTHELATPAAIKVRREGKFWRVVSASAAESMAGRVG